MPNAEMPMMAASALMPLPNYGTSKHIEMPSSHSIWEVRSESKNILPTSFFLLSSKMFWFSTYILLLAFIASIFTPCLLLLTVQCTEAEFMNLQFR
jgi:hypothetical protein